MTYESDRRDRRRTMYTESWAKCTTSQGREMNEAEAHCLEALLLFKEYYDDNYRNTEQEAMLRFNIEHIKQVLGITIKKDCARRKTQEKRSRSTKSI